MKRAQSKVKRLLEFARKHRGTSDGFRAKCLADDLAKLNRLRGYKVRKKRP